MLILYQPNYKEAEVRLQVLDYQQCLVFMEPFNVFNSVVRLCVKYYDKSFADVNFHHFINSMLKKDCLIFTKKNDWPYTSLLESW